MSQSSLTYTAGWSQARIEKRITLLARRVRTSVSMDTRALLRAEIDSLLDEHHERWPEKGTAI